MTQRKHTLTESRTCLGRIAHDRERLGGYLNLIFIADHLERVGDHATDIGEDAVYSAVGEDIRHQPCVPGK
jgi:phosphate transport system protein